MTIAEGNLRSRIGRACVAVFLLASTFTACSTEPKPDEVATAPADSVEIMSSAIKDFPADFSSAETPDASQLAAAKKAVDDAIADNKLKPEHFRPSGGDGQHIGLSDMKTGWATIMPHRFSHKNSLESGKPLAIINSDSTYPDLGIGKGVNYWVVAKSGSKFFSIMFPTDGTLPKVVPMNPLSHNDTVDDHDGAIARWVVQKGSLRAGEDAAWATCSSSQCCCTGTSCDLK